MVVLSMREAQAFHVGPLPGWISLMLTYVSVQPHGARREPRQYHRCHFEVRTRSIQPITLLFHSIHLESSQTSSYRLSVFGFPNSPAIPIDQQNLGIRDQRAALEWLRENLAAFGGDPTRITLGGQSAGADSAALLTYAFKDDPIVQGLILQSGIPEYVGPQDDFVFIKAAERVGCRNAANRTNELSCMKSVPAPILHRALSNLTVNPFGTTGGAPMIDNITLYSAEEYGRLGTAGSFARVVSISLVPVHIKS
jgi:hypothetical protein